MGKSRSTAADKISVQMAMMSTNDLNFFFSQPAENLNETGNDQINRSVLQLFWRLIDAAMLYKTGRWRAFGIM